MGLFDEVKENVTVRQAAELYGFKITKSGLISCIFHNDKTLEYDFLQEKTLFTKGFRWRKSFIILQSLFQDYGKSISLVRKIQERRQYF